jgi:DNA-binding LacI/PurR family transcriptional regulator
MGAIVTLVVIVCQTNNNYDIIIRNINVSKYWKPEIFPELSREWFVQYSKRIPRQAFEEWTRFVNGPRIRSNDAKFRKALELAADVTPGVVYHYLFGQGNRDPTRKDRKLGPQTVRDLDTVSKALGHEPNAPVSVHVREAQKGTRKIALLAELTGVPSPRFHLTVLAGIVRAGERTRNFSVALHEVRQSETDLPGRLARVLRNEMPHGVVWFRLTPDDTCLNVLSSYSANLPVVLVHAHRLRYPPPVIAHVVPRQEPICSVVEMWAGYLPELPNKDNRTVVIAAMQPEDTRTPPFEPLDPCIPVSIRKERVELIGSGIAAAGLNAVVQTVEDYSASRAYDVLQQYPNARGYVCLSDEIAVAVQQLLMARGEETRRRILGFDGSELARHHRIPSINQWLPDLGEKVIEPFETWFRQTQPVWDPCREIGVELSLVAE